ncbi:hypothetical protein DM02DRAFT_400165 [Periconia macrospinosa]|uniref:Uncharacterized protein n=1 Tax=Periconia macrospinosa TaxID=97972 RepID=A0A2V1DQC1_9PLEO|nr:hypothetical protein DM02DRAFT_400165 [Periconia macrospinosa]
MSLSSLLHLPIFPRMPEIISDMSSVILPPIIPSFFLFLVPYVNWSNPPGHQQNQTLLSCLFLSIESSPCVFLLFYFFLSFKGCAYPLPRLFSFYFFLRYGQARERDGRALDSNSLLTPSRTHTITHARKHMHKIPL